MTLIWAGVLLTEASKYIYNVCTFIYLMRFFTLLICASVCIYRIEFSSNNSQENFPAVGGITFTRAVKTDRYSSVSGKLQHR